MTTYSTRDMLGRRPLTPVTAARKAVLEKLPVGPGRRERRTLLDALDAITAEPIFAPEDLPAADRSTMDGYAVVAADTYGASQSMPAYLSIAGEVRMGSVPEGRVQRGSCFKIPTGGILPAGADAVVMFEHTVPVDSAMIEVVKGVGSGGNVLRKGDDIREGACAIAAGHRLRPQDLGLLAGLGITEVAVCTAPTVGILSTGDEIVGHDETPLPGMVRNINAVALGAAARRCGAAVVDYGIVADTESAFFPAIERAVEQTDLVLFSGGSSVGVRDLGEQAIERLGPPGILVHGVALKPGKPVIIGLCGATPLFGLPGHPVSAMVCFDLFVKPVLLRLSGLAAGTVDTPATIRAVLTRNINSAAGRLDLIRVRLDGEDGELQATPVLGRSGAISTLSHAHGYFMIDENSQGLAAGTSIEVIPYQ